MDRHVLAHPQRVEDPADSPRASDQIERPALGLDPSQALEDHADSGGVEILDLAQVNDQIDLALLDQVHDPLTEQGGGVGIDVASEGDHAGSALMGFLELEIHETASVLGRPQSSIRPRLSPTPGRWFPKLG